MDALAPFRIPVATLKADEASYEWKLGPDFLTLFDNEHEPVHGHFTVNMELEKTGGITSLDFKVKGLIETTCDRCMAPISMPIAADYQLIIKQGDPAESTDEIIFVDPDAPQLNIGQHLYDFIMLSIPISHRIPDCESFKNSPCDQAVLAYLSENSVNEKPSEADDITPWDELKKAIDN